jgi:hypothetical protein
MEVRMIRAVSRFVVATLIAAWLPLVGVPAQAVPVKAVPASTVQLPAPAPACGGVIVGSPTPTSQTLTASCSFIYTGGPLVFAAVAQEIDGPDCPAFPLACTWVTIDVDQFRKCGGSGGCVTFDLEKQRGIRRLQTLTCTVSVEPSWGPQIILGAEYACGNVGVVALPPNFRPPRPCDIVGCLTDQRLAA